MGLRRKNVVGLSEKFRRKERKAQNGAGKQRNYFSRVSLFKKVMILNAGVCSGQDLAARIALAFRRFEDFSWILIDSNRSEVQTSTNTFFMRTLRSSLEAS